MRRLCPSTRWPRCAPQGLGCQGLPYSKTLVPCGASPAPLLLLAYCHPHLMLLLAYCHPHLMPQCPGLWSAQVESCHDVGCAVARRLRKWRFTVRHYTHNTHKFEDARPT